VDFRHCRGRLLSRGPLAESTVGQDFRESSIWRRHLEDAQYGSKREYPAGVLDGSEETSFLRPVRKTPFLERESRDPQHEQDEPKHGTQPVISRAKGVDLASQLLLGYGRIPKGDDFSRSAA
jgi:hypothetical protein